jgi:hypothetical protein
MPRYGRRFAPLLPPDSLRDADPIGTPSEVRAQRQQYAAELSRMLPLHLFSGNPLFVANHTKRRKKPALDAQTPGAGTKGEPLID